MTSVGFFKLITVVLTVVLVFISVLAINSTCFVFPVKCDLSTCDDCHMVLSQVLIKLLSLHKNLTVSVSEGRLHPSLQTNAILVDCKYLFMRDELFNVSFNTDVKNS